MSITGEVVAFFILSLMAIGGAIFMINQTRVVHMVMSLALAFFGIAGIFVLLHAAFLAVVQVLIYAGAITILMLFGIMLTSHREDAPPQRPVHGFFSFAAVACLFGFLIWSVYTTAFPPQTVDAGQYDVATLGNLVFKQYVIPFELTSVLLLAALIGAIVLAKKEAE